MRKYPINKYKKINRILLKACAFSFILLIITQFYLKISIKSVEPFLNKMCNKDNFKFEVVKIIPKNNNRTGIY
ncbi:hypothetical protein SAMN02194393_02668 [Maledivibacter halophilus]|uniref:Uncharacterized protein n=1 Tax=Maledivibacter halophilus TaxID=36842 RepID=A0A1T5LAA7_9FIRM|nr:hypothetical protein SAMN02194393_02668 [Maledivibacter halophilus]